MRRALLPLSAALFAALFVGCGTAERPARHLVLSGSKTMAPLMTDISRRFEAKHRGVRIDVEANTSDRGVADTRTGLADLGMVARGLRPDEAGLHGTEIARDGVAVVVHRDNPVRALDSSQLVGLFTRRYVNWKEVGGTDRPVTLVSLPEGRALRDVFLDHLAVVPSRVKIEPPAPTAEQALAAVANHADAIGYVCLGRAELLSAKLPIRSLPLGGVEATLANVRSGRYPLTRPLLLLTREPPDGLRKQLVDFARSEEVRDLLEARGFAPPQNQDTRP